MRKPSVLFIDHAGVLGGAELYLLDIVRPLASTSRVVLLEDGPFAERLREAGVATEIVSASPRLLDVKKSGAWRSALASIPGLVSTVCRVARRAVKHDVLFANSQKALVVAGLAGAVTQRPVIWNLHDILTADHFSDFNRRLAVVFGNYFTDRIIVNSKATQDAFLQSGGRVEKPVIVYNGIDPTPFAQFDPADVSPFRETLDVPQNVPLVGVFSRLAPWKGQHVLLDALPAVPDVHALLVGDALFRGDESYEETLRHRAVELGVADRVHFLGFRSDVPRLMQLVDIVVHTSVAPEPFGRVIVEGMLAAKPVIATRAGGAIEVIREPDTGTLIPGGDATTLAGAIQAVLDAPREAEQMGRAARIYAEQRFGIDEMQRCAHRVIERTIRNSG